MILFNWIFNHLLHFWILYILIYSPTSESKVVFIYNNKQQIFFKTLLLLTDNFSIISFPAYYYTHIIKFLIDLYAGQNIFISELVPFLVYYLLISNIK